MSFRPDAPDGWHYAEPWAVALDIMIMRFYLIRIRVYPSIREFKTLAIIFLFNNC